LDLFIQSPVSRAGLDLPVEAVHENHTLNIRIRPFSARLQPLLHNSINAQDHDNGVYLLYPIKNRCLH